MPFSAFVDVFNIGLGAVASTVVRTSYGFQPKACLYWWSGRTEAVDALGRLATKAGIGMAVSPTDRRCVTVASTDATGNMNTARRHSNTQCIDSLVPAATIDGNVDLQTFDADGQTLVIDDQFTTNLRVHCLALGGSDLLEAATFEVQAPLTATTQDVTLGFQPDALLLCSIHSATAPPANTTVAQYSFGVAAPTGQGVVAGFDGLGGTSNCCRYGRTGECIAMPTAVDAITFRASLTTMLPTGFRLTWSEVDGATQPYILGLALRGGSYAVGSLLTALDTTTPIVVAGLGFQPRGVFFLSHMTTASTADTVQASYGAAIGAMTSPSNRGAQAFIGRTGENSSTNASIVEHDACYAAQVMATHTSINALMDIQSVESDGFTAIMDDADTAASLIHYLAMGDGGGGPTTRDLTASLAGASVTPAASADLLTQRDFTSMLAGVSRSSVAAAGLTLPNFGEAFTVAAGGSHAIAAATHGYGHPNLRVQVYDDATPRQRLRVPVSVHPSTFLVTLAFLQAQSGWVVVNGGADATPEGANQGYAFTDATAASPVVIPGSTHGYGHANLLVDVYDASTPRVLLPDADVTVHPDTLDITVRFLQPQSGLVVVCGASGASPNNSGTPFTNATNAAPVVIAGTTHGRGTASLGVTLYDPAGVEVQGVVTVHPSTYDVTVSFLQPQSGTLVLNGTSVLVIRALTAALQATSTTPDTLVTTARLLTASASQSSVTPASTVTLVRDLPSRLEGLSVTPDALAQLLTVRALAASALGASATAASLVNVDRRLTSRLSGASTTPDTLVVTQRALSATLAASSVTPTSLVAQTRSLSVLLLGASATPASAVGLERGLLARAHGTSTTPSSGVVQGRTLTTAVLGASATPAVAVTSTRPLSATLAGSSTASTPAAFLTAVRALTASLSGSSTTTASEQTLARTLTAACTGLSITAEVVTTLAQVRLLTATLAGTSLTPASALTQVRRLPSALLGTSATPDSLVLHQRLFQAQGTGTSVTSTATAALTAVRALTATLSGSSATSASTVVQHRTLSAQALGTSLTPDAAVVLLTQRLLTTALVGSSVTPASLTAIQRPLTATATGTSTTRTASAFLTAIRALSAAIAGHSATPASAVLQQHLLSAQVLGSSLTPAAAGAVQRPLAAGITGTSLTPASASAVLRPLSARSSASSTTRPANAIVSGLRALTAVMVAHSATLTSGVTQARGLVSTLLGSSTTPVSLSAVQRPLTAALVASSTTPLGLLVNTAMFQSRLHGSSTTPTALVTLARTLTGQMPGLSATPPVLVQHLRLLQGAMAGVSLTPASQGLLVRHLSSLLAGSSATTSSSHVLARALVAVLTGRTQTPGILPTTVRPLGAALLGSSVTPVSLFVPNSGEMTLVAHLLGVSGTAGGRFVLLPWHRVGSVAGFPRTGTAVPKERIGTVPVSRETTVVG